jgi:hypothetical protein
VSWDSLRLPQPTIDFFNPDNSVRNRIGRLQAARRVRARGEADREDGPVDRLPAERAAKDGGPGLSSGAGCAARKACIKILLNPVNPVYSSFFAGATEPPIRAMVSAGTSPTVVIW